MTDHDDQRARYRAYRDAAKYRLQDGDCRYEIHVPEHADVQMVEDGAYVEARIWIPKKAIEEQKERG